MNRIDEESFSIGVGGQTGLTNGIPTGGQGKGVFAFPLFSRPRKRTKKSRKTGFGRKEKNTLKSLREDLCEVLKHFR